MSISNNYDTKASVSFNPPTYVDALVMTGFAITGTVPALVGGVEPRQMVISASGNFYARFDDGAASIPTGNVTNGTASMLNPTYLRVFPGETISFIGAPGVILTIAFYGE